MLLNASGCLDALVAPEVARALDGFVTNPSSCRATSGAVNASRHPEALSSRKDRPVHTKTPQLAVDLDRTAVAGAVPAGHRRLAGELGVGDELSNRFQHRLGAAGQDIATVCC